MEAFTLLKYWHTLFAGDATFAPCPAAKLVSGSPCSDDGDDGPFFDLEFSFTAAEEALANDVWERSPEAESEPGTEELSDVIDGLEVKGPLVTLFARENCSKANRANGSRLTKEVVQKYLKLLKPFYSIERMKCSGQVQFSGGSGAVSPPWLAVGKGVEEVQTKVPSHKRQGGSSNNLQSGLRVVLKQLGKSRSSSALVAAASPPSSRRRSDDTMVELQDGIQGAIMYCKRSYSMPSAGTNIS